MSHVGVTSEGDSVGLASRQGLWLGVDLGTTSVKAVLLDAEGKVVATASKATDTQVESSIGSSGNEQNSRKILETVNDVVVPLLQQHAGPVEGIGLTGQMHGVVLWGARKELVGDDQFPTLDMGRPCSNNYTWQDQRCSQEFLDTLPRPSSTRQSLSTGHGCATLYWLVKNVPGFFDKSSFTSCGCIMDFLTYCLCDLDEGVTSDQLAASMGYYHETSHSWDKELYEDPVFPSSLLPKIVPVGTKVGLTSPHLAGWPQDVPVYVCMGDVQCATYALLKDNHDAAINISTSIQLGFVMSPEDVASLTPSCPPSLAFFPYFQGQFLALCAGLNGGNALGYLAECLGAWIVSLGFAQDISTPALLLKLQELAESDSVDGEASAEDGTDVLQFSPAFFGERHDPSLRGHIGGLSGSNFASVGKIFRAASEGLLNHLHSMISAKFLVSQGISRLLVSGSVPVRNSIVRRRLEELYSGESLQVVMNPEGQEAVGSAVGAALVVMRTQLPTSM
ncbi:sedoheptulokinase [Aplysia californica]|uniref:Sedoheptulokinase n=1 Tax=Aplysia californica TaxID=6500 RepID=A0ABM0ZVG6_APLCA|nr:sedoheptulokinase [Aplysia californica]XP_012935340.1 sedoheptulokinase [Aplysia californica]